MYQGRQNQRPGGTMRQGTSNRQFNPTMRNAGGSGRPTMRQGSPQRSAPASRSGGRAPGARGRN
jgi:hypothetical protein